LRKNKAKIKKGKFIADVGFEIRKNARGGGTSLSPKMMRTMSDLGISLYLSEYP